VRYKVNKEERIEEKEIEIEIEIESKVL